MASTSSMPHLQQFGNTKQLIVNSKPYLMLGGELQNSSLSSADYMSEVWPKMVASNVNTLLGSVSWVMIEPEEDKFDFEELDKVILGAREHDLHLILLWFGAFKNGMSIISHTESSCVDLAQADQHIAHHGLKQIPIASRALSYGRLAG
jgi:GH35 family endo-1,4-beta-xylanase